MSILPQNTQKIRGKKWHFLMFSPYCFEADLSDIPDKIKDLNKTSEDAAESVGKVDSEAKELEKSLAKAAKSAAKFAAAYLSIKAIRSTVLGVAEETDALGKFSARLGENIEGIDAWGHAVELSGGSVDGFRSSLESLNEKIVETSLKGTSSILPFLNQMGIAFTDSNGRARSTLDILPELADSFQNLSRVESSAIGKQLGLDAGTITLLQQGRSEVEKLLEENKRLGTTTQRQAELSAKFKDSLSRLGRAFGTLKRILVADILPLLTLFTDVVTDVVVFLKDNKFFALSFFSSIAVLVAGVFVPAMIAAHAATLLAIGPFLLIGAAIGIASAAIALLVDDIYNFLRGNDSVIGEISKKWPIVGDVFEALKDRMETIIGVIFGIIDKFTEYLENPKQIIQDIIDLFNELLNLSLEDVGSGIFGFAKKLLPGIDILLKTAGVIDDSATSPVNGITSNTIQNSNMRGGDKSFSIGDINVTTPESAISSKDAGRVAAGEMKNQLRGMVDSFDDGVVG